MEKIDELRELLDLHNRNVVSMVMLQGVRETTDFGSMMRTFAPNGDIAIVFVGPKEKLVGERREDKKTGKISYYFEMPAEESA